MANAFQRAVKHEAKLRLAISGPSGAGKTYTSLKLAQGLGKKIALIDTERGSASKYADEFEFDVLEVRPPYHPDRFLAAIACAEKEGYDVCIVDSLSHAWNGQGGVLEVVDEESRKSKGNSYVAWAKGTPLQNKFIDGLTSANLHIIGTMRSKTDYVLEQGSNGKTTPRKVGMAPIQRDGFEYEFDVALEMTLDNDGIVQKTRCSAIAGKIFAKPGEDLAQILAAWLQGAPPREKTTATNGSTTNGSTSTSTNGTASKSAVDQTKAYAILVKAAQRRFNSPEAFTAWVSANAAGKTPDTITEADCKALYEKLASEILAEKARAEADAAPPPPSEDRTAAKKAWYAALAKKLDEHTASWWGERDHGFIAGDDTLATTPVSAIVAATKALKSLDEHAIALIQDDYRTEMVS